MFPRILLFAGLIAMLVGVVDPAMARPRRRAVAQEQPMSVETKPTAIEPMKQVMYPVADLVVPIPSRPNLDVEPLPGPRTGKVLASVESEVWEVPASAPAKSGQPVATAATQAIPKKMAAGGTGLPALLPGQTTENLLIDLLKNTVAQDSWQDKGGRGTVQFYPLGMSLVVNQTPSVHEEVQALLSALRRLYDIEAAVEVRVVTATPAAFGRACKQMELTRSLEKDNPASEGKRTIAPKGKRWTTFLDKDQTRQLLTLLQEDRSTTVVQAPKITAFNGQIVALQCTDDRFLLTRLEVVVDQHNDHAYYIPTILPWETGLSMGMQSVVSADHQSVRVQMKGYWCQLAGPVALQPVYIPIKSKNEQGKEETTPSQVFLQSPTFAQVKLDETLNIPDGGTALVSCGVVPMEVERDDLVARICKLCGGERKTTSADRHVFVMITSRVIINDEQELITLTPSGQPVPIPRP